MPSRPRRHRIEVDGEGENVEGKDQGNNPFKDGASVISPRPCRSDKADGQEHRDADEGQLDPERDAQDTVVAVACVSLAASRDGPGVG